MTDDTLPTEKDAPDTYTKKLKKVVARAGDGDETSLTFVRQMMDRPGALEAMGGNLTEATERALVQAATGGSVLYREALHAKLRILRAELSGPDPTPIEKLLVDRCVMTWLQLSDADLRAARVQDSTSQQLEADQRRINHAHRRFLSSIRTLATVRRLAVPVLIAQMNIGKNQLNALATAATNAVGGDEGCVVDMHLTDARPGAPAAAGRQNRTT